MLLPNGTAMSLFSSQARAGPADDYPATSSQVEPLHQEARSPTLAFKLSTDQPPIGNTGLTVSLAPLPLLPLVLQWP